MGNFKTVFERTEVKYLINNTQKEALLKELSNKFVLDEYGKTTICNIYYDTPNYQIIRTSIEKPIYKEKLRLRCYGIPNENTNAFIEIKKKYKSIVNKRRVNMPYKSAFDFLSGKEVDSQSQILKEIDYFKHYYKGLQPTMFISYDRMAYFNTEDKDFRLTFDGNITWRTDKLDLCEGVFGNKLLKDDEFIMEAKILNAMPLWFADILDRLKIYPASYSKYGTAYKNLIA